MILNRKSLIYYIYNWKGGNKLIRSAADKLYTRHIIWSLHLLQMIPSAGQLLRLRVQGKLSQISSVLSSPCSDVHFAPCIFVAAYQVLYQCPSSPRHVISESSVIPEYVISHTRYTFQTTKSRMLPFLEVFVTYSKKPFRKTTFVKTLASAACSRTSSTIGSGCNSAYAL